MLKYELADKLHLFKSKYIEEVRKNKELQTKLHFAKLKVWFLLALSLILLILAV